MKLSELSEILYDKFQIDYFVDKLSDLELKEYRKVNRI